MIARTDSDSIWPAITPPAVAETIGGTIGNAHVGSG